METIDEIKTHYRWRLAEDENLKTLAAFGEKYQEEFIEELYAFFANFKDTRKYLPDENVRSRHKAKLKKWFTELFAETHDAEYLRRLYRIGEVHVQIGLPPHYVSASISFVRQFIYGKLQLEFGRTEERDRYMKSVDKLLDVNLDVMTSSYREEELKFYLASGRLQKTLLEIVRKGAWFFDFFRIFAFSLAGAFLVLWVGYEILMIVEGKLDLEHGALSIMGSVLIMFAISELIAEEVRHLRGNPLGLRVYVAVALAALIRKILVVSLDPEKTDEMLVLAVLLISLGGTYWLIRHAESRAS